MKYKNIFFDFDGVIAESVNVKTEAFYKLYEPYGREIAEKVKEHHLAHGGVSRFEKFRIYHDTFLDQQIDDDKVQELAQKFSDLVVDGVVNAPEVDGVEVFIKKYSEECRYFIITGTPTSEMIEIAKKRGILGHFMEICGSPTKKNEWSEYLIEKYNLIRDDIVFLGDAKSDMGAANNSGIDFILRKNDENAELFKDYKGPSFLNFYELNTYLEQQ